VNSNEFNPDEWPKPPKSLEDIYLSENSYTVMKLRYLRKGDDGEPIETVMECIWRVAINISKARFFNNLYNEEHINCAINYYDLIAKKYFSPNSPTFTGAGTPLGQLAACFVLPIDDEMGREENGIFQTMRNASLIQQTGGGNGFDFSKLRHKGAIVKSSGGLASGPLGFLGVYDKAFGEVAQGGTRRGANMAVLRVDHPDIIEFIGCKGLEGSIENFNISVGVTDEFMKSLLLDDDFNLVAPHNGKVIKTLKAKFIWEKIIEGAHNNGEPGILFLDTANKYNPVPNLYKLEATNPCGFFFLNYINKVNMSYIY
jgi:ribonucleoside-diphosphate reductase alpha chain